MTQTLPAVYATRKKRRDKKARLAKRKTDRHNARFRRASADALPVNSLPRFVFLFFQRIGGCHR
jgi:hypothetical protein